MSSRAHDLNSTFATLNTQAQSIEHLFSPLVEGYRLAREHNLLEAPALQDRQLELLQALVKGLTPELRKLEALIPDVRE